MRYNFRLCSGKEWYDTIKRLHERGLTFLEVRSEDLFNADKVCKVYNVYYCKTSSECRIIYYDIDYSGIRWEKKFRKITFSENDIDATRCVREFNKIAKRNNEIIKYEPNKVYTNGVYSFFSKPYKGYATALDMNSAYLFALSQKLADWESRREILKEDIYKQEYDFYSFENEVHCEMFYKEDIYKMEGALIWADVKVYGYKGKSFFPKTSKELYELRKIDKEKYKNIANVAVGCMHKHSGEKNNCTIAASLYAWFAWYISDLVYRFDKKGYNVIMITTDSIKIAGKYDNSDNLVVLGEGLGEFKVEFEGECNFISSGHYEDTRVKWKGKPQYLIDGYKPCKFIDNIEEEKEIYERYARVGKNG